MFLQHYFIQDSLWMGAHINNCDDIFPKTSFILFYGGSKSKFTPWRSIYCQTSWSNSWLQYFERRDMVTISNRRLKFNSVNTFWMEWEGKYWALVYIHLQSIAWNTHSFFCLMGCFTQIFPDRHRTILMSFFAWNLNLRTKMLNLQKINFISRVNEALCTPEVQI